MPDVFASVFDLGGSVLEAAFWLVVILSVLVAIHELGHYVPAKLMGMHATTFSIGMGPRVCGWIDPSGTEWRISAIPIGGYVKFLGDDDNDKISVATTSTRITHDDGRGNTYDQYTYESFIKDHERYMCFRPGWQKAIVVAGGPLVNIVFCILIVASMYVVDGRAFGGTVVGEVVEGSPADTSGISVGDKILRIDDVKVDRFEDLAGYVKLRPGETVRVAVRESGGRVSAYEVKLETRILSAVGESRIGFIGVVSSEREFVTLSPLAAVHYAITDSIDAVRGIFVALDQIVSTERSFRELGGPVKIAQLSDQAADAGPNPFLLLMALLSLNLGILNLLPIPGLDGGYLTIYSAEGLLRRKLPTRALEYVTGFGVAGLVLIMIIVTVSDIASLFGV